MVGAGGSKSLYPKDDDNYEASKRRGMKNHFFEDKYYGFGYFAISQEKITVQLINAKTAQLGLWPLPLGLGL